MVQTHIDSQRFPFPAGAAWFYTFSRIRLLGASLLRWTGSIPPFRRCNKWLFFCSGSKWRKRALPCDLISSLSCCSPSQLSARRKHCMCFRTSISCRCYRRIRFLINLFVLFRFLKVPSIRCGRAMLKIRWDECRSSALSRRRLVADLQRLKKVKHAQGLSGEAEVGMTAFTGRYISWELMDFCCVELWECWQGSFYPRLSFASGSIRQMLLSLALNLNYHQRSCWPCPTCPLQMSICHVPL